MAFNSFVYFVFLAVVAAVFWNVGARRRPAVLALASAVFYGWWDWRLLGLMYAVIAVNYACGLAMAEDADRRMRRTAVAAAVTADLGLLGTVKYYDFFARSLGEALAALGAGAYEPRLLGWVLPVGISFYTFQLVAYAVDVYRRRVAPERDFTRFAAFVSFFPQLVAGPIERAADLLPQMSHARRFSPEAATAGLRLVLWGLLKKMILADNCAAVADRVFAAPGTMSGADLWLGTLCFAFQIYGDFSGYSDIAVGSARLLGIRLTRNFSLPYFAVSPADFWHRWHVSLMLWLRDYVYIPLGGSRRGPWRTAVNRTAVFLASGLWHGAAWHFVAWGVWHAALFPLDAALTRLRLPAAVRHATTMTGVLAGWVVFRAATLEQAAAALATMCTPSLFGTTTSSRLPLVYIAVFTAAEALTRRRESPLERFGGAAARSRALRWAVYYALLLALFALGGRPAAFVYFQF